MADRDFIVPNFANQTISYATSQTAPYRVTIKVKIADGTFRDPLDSEQNSKIAANAPNSEPGSVRESGEWVGVEVTPV